MATRGAKEGTMKDNHAALGRCGAPDRLDTREAGAS
jgi:hypothetical protein